MLHAYIHACKNQKTGRERRLVNLLGAIKSIYFVGGRAKARARSRARALMGDPCGHSYMQD